MAKKLTRVLLRIDAQAGVTHAASLAAMLAALQREPPYDVVVIHGEGAGVSWPERAAWISHRYPATVVLIYGGSAGATSDTKDGTAELRRLRAQLSQRLTGGTRR